MNRVPLDFHTVDMLLVMHGRIDIPGCVGFIPVFIDKRAAEIYRGSWWKCDAYTISPWASPCEEQEEPS